MSGTPHCIPITKAQGVGSGGKAEGLAVLTTLGLHVPDGFVILNATLESLPDDLELAYDHIGRGRVAVRSSASDEDGVATSFAGQHSTVLDVEGMPALRDAVKHCLGSLFSERAQAYRKTRTSSAEASMSIVVQRMVDARCAGVIFTADPITARRDRMIVEAVEGHGSALVGGKVTPDHFTLKRDGLVVKRETLSNSSVQDDELFDLVTGALRVEQTFELPVECEWAIDAEGRINWLQARPITALPADPCELDSELKPDEIYSRCNVGEILPGVMTPLTSSTQLLAMDQGMQRMYNRIATLEIQEKPILVVQQFGRMFLNLSLLAGTARSMAGGSEVVTVEAICGRPVSDIVPGPRAPQSERLRNGFGYITFMLFGRHIAKFKRLIASINPAFGADASETYTIIDRELPMLNEAWYLHDTASMLAASLVPAMLQIISKGAQPTEQHRAELAQLLAGTEDVESYDIAAGIDRIVSALTEHDGPELDRFLELDVHAADRFLRQEASSPARHEYNTYLERHGHRSVRELELREKEWAEDPTPIVEAVLSGIRATRSRHTKPPKGKPGSVPPMLALLVRIGRRGIRDREMSKSLLVMVGTHFKRAYRTLARQMVDEGLLPDDDLVFFLQHAELGELLRDRDPQLIKRALARRDVLPYQEKLFFKDNSRGKAEPIDPPRPSGEGILHGKPASLGVVRGRARVALTLADAGEVQPDEILIAPVIDVGWTPTFATIAGFASDVGSAVSHGAVVAREYGIPAVVSLHNATATFRTGDLVELDADHGVLQRISEA
jgi:Phosphoenolpyruvate synthase/pyruvate phosphate dikinase